MTEIASLAACFRFDQTKDSRLRPEVRFNGEAARFYLGQVKLFQRSRTVVSRLVRNVERESDREVTRDVEYFNLGGDVEGPGLP